MPASELIGWVEFGVAVVAFFLGAWSVVRGISIIAASELSEIKKIQSQLGMTVATGGLSPADLADLIEAVAKLLAVKSGPGAFLCLLGLALGVGGWFLLTQL